MNFGRFYKIIVGALYITYGVIQIYNGTSSLLVGVEGIQLGLKVFGTYIPKIFPDPFAGIALLTVGSLLLHSAHQEGRDENKERGYLLAAWILAVTMLGLNLIEILSGIADAYYPLLYGCDPNYEWSLAEDAWGLSPHFLLGILTLPFYIQLKTLLKELFPQNHINTS
ncbi:MAG TPA: hypothetical protein ENJ59_01540 [Thermofilum sp.]|nr:hypothetical protein [Thermofilum sp.]